MPPDCALRPVHMNYPRRSQCADLMHDVRMYSNGHIMACVRVDTRFLDAKYTYHQNNGRGSVSTPRSQPGVRPAQGTHLLQFLLSVITRQLLIRSALVCTRPPLSPRVLRAPPVFASIFSWHSLHNVASSQSVGLLACPCMCCIQNGTWRRRSPGHFSYQIP